MFEQLAASAIEPELLKILHAVDSALGGVQTRLVVQSKSTDPLTALTASVQLNALATWKPALADMSASLSKPAAPAPHAPLPGHGH